MKHIGGEHQLEIFMRSVISKNENDTLANIDSVKSHGKEGSWHRKRERKKNLIVAKVKKKTLNY